jgi:hypothetical protein
VQSKETFQTPRFVYKRQILEYVNKIRHLHQPNKPRGKVAAFTSAPGAHASAWMPMRPSNDTMLDNYIKEFSLCNSFNAKSLLIYCIPGDALVDCPFSLSLDSTMRLYSSSCSQLSWASYQDQEPRC